MARNRQAQPHAAVGSGKRRVALVEALPDALDLLVGHADARIDDRDPRPVARLWVGADVHRYPAGIRGELQSVADVATQDVRELLFVGFDARRDTPGDRQSQFDPLGFGLALKVLNDLADDAREIDRLNLEPLDAGFEPRVIQQAIHQLEQAIARGAHVADVLVGQRRQRSRQAAQEHVGVAKDGR